MLITVNEYAELKKLPISKIYYHLRMGMGKIEAFKIGSLWRILI